MKRYNILALATYSIDKPRGGGQVVVSGIYKYLSNFFDVTVLSIVSHNHEKRTASLKTGLQNIIIPMSYEETKILWDLERKYGIGLSDYVHINNISLSKKYTREFERLSKEADMLIFEHPYLINLLGIKINKKIIYHAIDVEFLQKKGLYKNYPELLDGVRTAEAKACNYADAIFVTCEAEKTALKELYPEYVNGKSFFIVPNGIDASTVPFITREDHYEAKKNYGGLFQKIICLFVGSWHPPNLEALEFIINELAPRNTEVQYFVIGSVRDYFYNRYGTEARVPDNVHLFGTVGEDEKWELYKLADIAINPMFSGAGMNVKMLEYMAAGLPIITTPFGARGIESAGVVYFEDAEGFIYAIDTIMRSQEMKQKMILQNLNTVRLKYNFPVIARNIMGFIYNELLGDYNSYLIDSLSEGLQYLGIYNYNLIAGGIAGELIKIVRND